MCNPIARLVGLFLLTGTIIAVGCVFAVLAKDHSVDPEFANGTSVIELAISSTALILVGVVFCAVGICVICKNMTVAGVGENAVRDEDVSHDTVGDKNESKIQSSPPSGTILVLLDSESDSV